MRGSHNWKPAWQRSLSSLKNRLHKSKRLAHRLKWMDQQQRWFLIIRKRGVDNKLTSHMKINAIFSALSTSVLLTLAQAVIPPPDGGYSGGNTATGQNALLSLSSGTYNTGVGLFSLVTITDGNFCTGIGAGTLLNNTA